MHKRIMIDIKDFFLQETSLFKYVGMDFENGNRTVSVEIKGPAETSFQGGTFLLDFEIPLDFPFSPPSIFCKTRVWHPNISIDGKVCMDLLDTKWSAGTALIELAEAVRSLLDDPNPNSPINKDASSLLRHYPEMYKNNAALWTNNLAGGNASTSLQESLGILTRLGLPMEAALERGALNAWDMSMAVDGL